MKTKKYRLVNLGCANCAAKMEAKINSLQQVEEAVITFALKQLKVTAEDPDALLDVMLGIVQSIESQVEIEPWSSKKVKTDHHHEHEHEHCDCGHDHHHEHEHEHCDCGHDHHHEHEHEHCDCGHDHHHEHEHEHEHCDFGHDHHHHHEHEHCDCGHDHHHEHEHEHEHHHHHHSEGGLKLIIAGAALFALGLSIQWITGVHAGETINVAGIGGLILFLVSYIILGKDIIWQAIKGIGHGQIFDENFLMSIATLGAIAIGEYAEAVGVMLFFQVGEYFEHRAVDKSRSAIMEAVDMRPEMVTRQIGKDTDAVETIPAEEAEVGDVLLVRPGDRIPLDGVVIDGITQIDTSPVTGEPVPVSAKEGTNVISGCVNITGLIKMRVEKPLEESMVTRILESVENAAASKPQMERFITRFAKVYTPIVVAIAVLTAVVPSLITGNWNYWIYTALTFLVISCPCAMVLSVPLAFFAGIGAGSRKGILFKGGTALEALRKVKAVVMDKTGTITKGNFVVQSIELKSDYTLQQVLEAAAACESHSNHPIALSIVEAARQQLQQLPAKPEKVTELAGMGAVAQVGGSEILCGNDKLLAEYGIVVKSTENYGTHVYVAIDGTLAGVICIADTIKEDAAEAIRKMKDAGVQTVMLTGDAKESAEAVAKTVGVEVVKAELLPQDKLTAMQQVRDEQGGVMFVGDGINDAPVLAGADVGAAMGSGADAAIEAADVVFMTSKMEAIPQAMEIARKSMSAAVQNVVFALLIKVIVMILGLLGIANMWLAVFADSGVALLCVLNSIRILRK